MAEESKGPGLGLLLGVPKKPTEGEAMVEEPVSGVSAEAPNEAADMAASAAFSAVKEDDEVAFKDALRQFVLALKP